MLKQRNNLLKNIQKDHRLKDTLFVWDKQLVEFGTKIIQFREKFVADLSEKASLRHRQISSSMEELSIIYMPSSEGSSFEEKLLSSVERDIFMGSTSHGPHRDDAVFNINGNDVRIYGSQGQQRTAAVSAKLAEIDIINEEAGIKPVLLLDDVLSELDKKRQHMLMDCISEIQTIIAGILFQIRKINMLCQNKKLKRIIQAFKFFIVIWTFYIFQCRRLF